ncbi:MAG: AAA family ATPase [Clostridiales bacterium]|nr:AAA family ATPase [Clostridiales bacterium]
MKIISVHVVAFGKLKNVNLQFNSGLNVLQEANSFGKTTMAGFIRAMLYGLASTRSKDINNLSHFAPWGSTDKFGGSMVVEHNGETYRIERFFGSTARHETLRVTNEKTGSPVDWVKQPGEMLLGLTADSYDRSAYFPQEAVELANNENLDNRLANLVGDTAEDYEKVQERLRSYKKSLRYERGLGGKIYELETQKRQLEEQLNNAQQAERRASEIDKRLAQIEQEKRALEQRYAECQEQLTNLQLTTQSTFLDIKHQKKQPILNKFTIVVGIILIVIGIVFAVLGAIEVLPLKISLVISVGAFGLVGVGLILVLAEHIVQKYRPSGLPNGTQQSITESAGNDKFTTQYLEDAQRCVKALSELSTETGRLSEERKGLTFNSVEIMDEIMTVEEQRKDAVHRYEVADRVVKLLEQAKDNLSSSYLPRLCARCSELLQEITQNEYSVVVDRNFTVSLREKGQTQQISEFSRGIREITLLCFRIALSELLYDNAISFVIIDDAFVNFDEDNFARATMLLKKLSTHAQVVYFTCHQRTGKLLK